MIKIILLVATLLFCSAATYSEGPVFGYLEGQPSSATAIFVNSYTQAGAAAGVWTIVDVTTLGVPNDVKAVFLSGLLIVTGGSTSEACNLTIEFRPYGSTASTGNYSGQALNTLAGSGVRSGLAVFVQTTAGKFEFKWTRSTTNQWPTSCAYGINLSAQSYVR